MQFQIIANTSVAAKAVGIYTQNSIGKSLVQTKSVYRQL